MKILSAIGLTIGLFCSSAMASVKCEYSYTFSDPPPNENSTRTGAQPATAYTFFGTFQGIANGDLITSLTDVTLSVRDNHGNVLMTDEAVVGYLSLYPFRPGVASFSGHNNQFIFDWDETSGAPAPALGFGFASYGSATDTDYYGQGVDIFVGYGTTGLYAHDFVPEPSSWSVTAVSSVPEPETWALLGLGLIAMCGLRQMAPGERLQQMRNNKAQA